MVGVLGVLRCRGGEVLCEEELKGTRYCWVCLCSSEDLGCSCKFFQHVVKSKTC